MKKTDLKNGEEAKNASNNGDSGKFNGNVYKNGTSKAIDYDTFVELSEQRLAFKIEADKAFELAKVKYLASKKEVQNT